MKEKYEYKKMICDYNVNQYEIISHEIKDGWEIYYTEKFETGFILHLRKKQKQLILG